MSIKHICQFCGTETTELDPDYLVGYDHLYCTTMQQLSYNSKQPEYCIICGEETVYTTSTPVAERSGYVEGAGQLCVKCCVSNIL